MDCQPEMTYISQSNQFIIVCYENEILLYDEQTNAKMKYSQTDLCVQELAFDQASFKIAVNQGDNSILILQVHKYEIIKIFQSLPAHFNRIKGLIFFEKGKKLISCSHDEMIFIWNLETFQVIHQINQLKGKIQHQLLFHNQKFLTTISSDGNICFYNLENRKLFYHTNRVLSKVQEICGVKQNLMKNEQILVQIDDKIKIISLNKQKTLRVLQLEGEFMDALFCFNDRVILIINYVEIKLFDYQSCTILKTMPQNGCFYSLDKENNILVQSDIYGSTYQKLILSI
ncbi:unnamed protein product (macronuclear) [Paramecium tetraurelia]|uniref:Uncharacterized protein n=1 Tax=Paramecium tetraurelia TaxID=5888 RepID=A0CWT3_PARTE|nr:uncharacterized protein GSPATT00001453001 [Paramecium tetraurelia]CAK75250.1 unnamed protein product [Paramecium tetraurelia]|eukprot:XP_001442647.1 hypothetical protein (macronuclear) [Paramecium tetraurelia strain d4-2]